MLPLHQAPKGSAGAASIGYRVSPCNELTRWTLSLTYVPAYSEPTENFGLAAPAGRAFMSTAVGYPTEASEMVAGV